MIVDCVSSLMIALLLKEHAHEIYSQLMLSLSRNRICKHEDPETALPRQAQNV